MILHGGTSMRLTSDKAKACILHPERHVREGAVYYFSRSYSQDRVIAPLAIQAIEKYGDKAFEVYSFLSNVIHTDDTVAWMIGRLESMERPADDVYLGTWPGLVSGLRNADAGTLERHLSKIQTLDQLDGETHHAILERIRLAAVAPEALLAELEDFCERHKSDNDVPRNELDRANRLSEALGRHRDTMVEKVMAVLRTDVEDYTDSPMTWMELAAVEIAGRMRLDEAVPQIIEKLHEDSDWLRDECMWALTRIGSDAVVSGIAEAFSKGDFDFRFSAACLLEDIHSDLSVQQCHQLLDREGEKEIRRELLQALLVNGATEAFEPARQWLLDSEKDPQWLELRSDLVSAATIMEWPFPELAAWRGHMKNDTAFRKQWYAKFVPRFAEQVSEDDYAKGEYDDDDTEWPTVPPLTVVADERPGRNDPCPCGSGKKYKKCCMRKENETLRN